MDPLLLTSMAALSTSVGGCCTVFWRRRLHLLMAFGAGVLLGAALLDLLPAARAAAIQGNYPGRFIFEFAAFGAFLTFCMHREGRLNVIDRLAGTEDNSYGKLAAGLLILHSALDGSAIFAASKVSVQIGLIVGLGVVAHDMCDGLNTVLLSSGCNQPSWRDYAMLGCDALAPIGGGLLAGHVFSISPTALTLFLSFATGSFLYTAIFALFADACEKCRRLKAGWLAIAGFLLILGLTISSRALS